MTTDALVTVDVPDGYVAERERGAYIVALPSIMEMVQQAITESGTLFDWAASRPGAREYTGRGSAWGVATPDGDWVVRHYRRGGAAARVLNDRYINAGATRPLIELTASVRARNRGVATPEVVTAVVYAAGPTYRADLATRLVRDSADLAESVLGPDRLDAAGRLAAWRAAGDLLRIAFAAGVEHADLNLRNILIQRSDAGTQAHLLDLDRAVVREQPVSQVARSSMLQRLHRSRRKLETAAGGQTSSDELEAFDAALLRG
ncbi:3-deoxy-D-manno-octulosonic acid kinase [soil metagenome]